MEKWGFYPSAFTSEYVDLCVIYLFIFPHRENPEPCHMRVVIRVSDDEDTLKYVSSRHRSSSCEFWFHKGKVSERRR